MAARLMAVTMRTVNGKTPPAIVAADHAIAVLLDSEMSDHADQADDGQIVRQGVAPRERHVHSERQRADDVDGAEDREVIQPSVTRWTMRRSARRDREIGDGLWP